METNILFKKLSFAEIRDGLAIIHDEGELLFAPVPSPPHHKTLSAGAFPVSFPAISPRDVSNSRVVAEWYDGGSFLCSSAFFVK